MKRSNQDQGLFFFSFFKKRKEKKKKKEKRKKKRPSLIASAFHWLMLKKNAFFKTECQGYFSY
jgi:hypothetical protein